jgi:hypothetical protein
MYTDHIPMKSAVTCLAFLACSLASPAQQKAPPAHPPAKSEPDAQLYRNTTFAFRYQIPYGWVDRTKEMREQEASDKPDTKKSTNPGQGQVLLAIFERPPAATGETVNSAVVIAAESATTYPGLKKAEDYLAPLTELATSRGFKAEGDPAVIEIDARPLVRADFTRPLGVSRNNDNLIMRQATLILLAHGQIVSFTFIASTEDDLETLIDNLHFGTAKPAAR